MVDDLNHVEDKINVYCSRYKPGVSLNSRIYEHKVQRIKSLCVLFWYARKCAHLPCHPKSLCMALIGIYIGQSYETCIMIYS
jgi:hypothetical protein